MAGIDGANLTDVQIVQGHEQLGTQGAVVHVSGAQEKRPEELQHHVVEFNVLPDHLRELLHNLLHARDTFSNYTLILLRD